MLLRGSIQNSQPLGDACWRLIVEIQRTIELNFSIWIEVDTE